MMKKSKSNPWMKSKALYVIPVAALALSAFATPKFVAPIEETVTKLEGKGTENSANLQVLEQENEPVVQKDMAQSSTENVTSEEVKQQDTDEQPLFVLDGKIIEVPEDMKDVNFKRMHEEQLTKLLNINAEDVESIAVLKKDEATKIWGDKGSNGAIEINTRSGQRDDESNIKADRSALDLFFGCLLEWGLPLSMPFKSEEIDGFMIYTYNEGDLIACFDEDIPDSVIKAIAKRQPLRAVFRDNSFKSSPSKINVGEIFKMLAPDTKVKVI